MKKTTSIFLLVAMVLTLLTGCQKTPEVPVVVQKDQEQMLQTAEQGKDNSSLLASLAVPEHFTGDWTGVNGLVHVTADAEIVLPSADKIPTGSIARRIFTQEDLDTFLRVFFKGQPFYEEINITKQQALSELERYQAMQRGDIPLSGDTTYEKLPDVIAYYAELARTAPDEGELRMASTSFVSDGPLEKMSGWAEVDGRKAHLWVQNYPDFWDSAVYYVQGYGDMNSSRAQPISMIPEGTLSEPLTVDFPLEDAIRQGDALMAELGFENVVCDAAYPVFFMSSEPYTVSESEEDEPLSKEAWRSRMGYQLQYVRCLNGFPISYTPVTGTAQPEDETVFTPAWMYEFITLDFTKDGLVCFQWFSPHTDPVLQVEDTQLMPFAQIADIFSKMIMVKNSDVQYANERNGFTTFRNFEVHKVKLCLMRIKAKESFDEGLLVPVWDFWGTEKWTYDGWDNYGMDIDNGEEIILTINAIDGSLIDRELGY